MTRGALTVLVGCLVACGRPAVVGGDGAASAGGQGANAGGTAAGSAAAGGSTGAAGGSPAGGGAATCAPEPLGPDDRLKLVFVVDQGDLMCVADPPGTGDLPNGCDAVVVPQGVFQPARTRALLAALDEAALLRDAEVALVAFGTTTVATTFRRPTEPLLRSRVTSLQSELAGRSNLQRALRAATQLITTDAQRLGAEARARTRYAVLLVSAGLPTPRCSSVDVAAPMPPALPGERWPDTPGAGTWCNDPLADTLPGEREGFVPGGDLNQQWQLGEAVDDLLAVAGQHGLAEVRLHTWQVFHDATAQRCGAACDGFFGMRTADARATGAFVLDDLARRGRGSFVGNGELSASFARVPLFLRACPR
ncbi:MAG: hypothetical protein JNJ54_15315 [Myxococcaceae bacterium]|nr:hypothetical protein [Myxococcaceae bacterium]